MSQKAPCTAADIKKALAEKHWRDYFLTEVKSGATGTGTRILDAAALRLSYTRPYITGYEVKVTRSDFQRDNKFFTYLPLVHALYIVTPTGLIKREELPTEIGLIWYDPEKKSIAVKKKPQAREIEISSEMLLYIIYSRLDRERIPFYSDKAEYWRAWAEGKKENRDLGQRVHSRMASEIVRLEGELRAANRYGRDGEREEYKKLIQIMQDHGMASWTQHPDEWLEQQLAREYPAVLDDVQQQLEVAIKNIKRAKEAAQRDGEGATDT